MLNKRPIVAILQAADVEDTHVNLHEDGVANQWSIVKDTTTYKALLGPFPYGTIKSVVATTPSAEVRQIALIGASTTKETIVAATRYRVEIGNLESDYETKHNVPAIHSYTSAAVLSGTAATDRANVYVALAAKINAYGANNATAYTLTYAAFTGGTSTGDAATTFLIGETVTQETSSETAKVAKCTITSGTFAGDDAAGHIWLYDISDVSAWLETAKTLTAAGTVAGVSTNCVVTVTDATTVHNTGLAIVDNAGYFTSGLTRGGINYVAVTQGFSTDTVEISRAGVYPQGIGTVMLSLAPVYDLTKQNVLRGRLEYEAQDGDSFVAGRTYNQYVITLEDGVSDVSGLKETGEKQVILYVDAGATHLADLHGALTDGTLL